MSIAIPSAPRRLLPPQVSPSSPTGTWERYAAHRDSVVRAIRREAADHALVDDVVQDALLRAAVSPAAVSRVVERPRAWLERVALNLLRDRYRLAGPQIVSLDEDGLRIPSPMCRELTPGDDVESSWVPTPRGTVRAALLVDDLRRMLTDLPEISRRVLTLYYLEERSLEETAQALGERASLVKCRLYRARQLLKKRLAERSPLCNPRLAERSTRVAPRRGVRLALHAE